MTTHCPSPPLSNPYLTTSGLSEMSRYLNLGKGKAQKVEIQKLQNDIASMKSDNERLQSQLNERTVDNERLQSLFKERSIQYHGLQIQCNELHRKCKDLQTLKESLHSQLEKLTNNNAELDAQREKYKKKFVNTSTELYFLLTELGDFFRKHFNESYIIKTSDKSHIIKTRKFIWERLGEVLNTKELIAYVLGGMPRVREDFEKYLRKD